MVTAQYVSIDRLRRNVSVVTEKRQISILDQNSTVTGGLIVGTRSELNTTNFARTVHGTETTSVQHVQNIYLSITTSMMEIQIHAELTPA